MYREFWRPAGDLQGGAGLCRQGSRFWAALGQLGSRFDALRRKRDTDDAQQCGQQR